VFPERVIRLNHKAPNRPETGHCCKKKQQVDVAIQAARTLVLGRSRWHSGNWAEVYLLWWYAVVVRIVSRILKLRRTSAMSPEDLFDLLRRRPFVAFRIFATDGRTFDVRHPDQALVLKRRVILPLPAAGDEVAERSEHLALVHVVQLEELPSNGSPPNTPTNGPATA
jgi:hypothetical protein